MFYQYNSKEPLQVDVYCVVVCSWEEISREVHGVRQAGKITFQRSRFKWLRKHPTRSPSNNAAILRKLRIEYEGNRADSCLCTWNGWSQLKRSELLWPRNVSRQNICRGNSDRLERGSWLFRLWEGYCGIQNNLLQTRPSRRFATPSTQAIENWTVSAEIWQQHSILGLTLFILIYCLF